MELVPQPISKDGFSLKREVFNDFNFILALRELAKAPLDIKIAYNVNRIVRQAQKHIDEGQKLVKEIIERYAEKDENGKYKTENGDFVFKDEAAFKEEYANYSKQEVHFASYLLDIETLAGAKISPELLGSLEPLFKE